MSSGMNWSIGKFAARMGAYNLQKDAFALAEEDLKNEEKRREELKTFYAKQNRLKAKKSQILSKDTEENMNNLKGSIDPAELRLVQAASIKGNEDAKRVLVIIKNAEEGDAEAQFQLFVLLANGGFGLTKDIPRATKWIILANWHRHPKAMKEIVGFFSKHMRKLNPSNLKDAHTLLNSPDPISAIRVKAYKQGVKEFMAKAEPYFYAGEEAFKQKNIEDAINNFAIAVRYAPFESVYCDRLGSSYEIAGWFDDAINIYRTMIDKFSKSYQPYFKLGSILFLHKHLYDDAIQVLLKGLEQDTGGKEYLFYTLLGSIYREKGDIDNAINLFRKVTEIIPNDGLAFRELGLIYAQEQDFEKAIRLLRKAVKLDPGTAETLHFLGHALIESNQNRKEGLSYIRKAIELDATNPEFYFNLGRYYLFNSFLNYKHKDNFEAKKNFRKAIQLNPRIPDFYIPLTVCLDRDNTHDLIELVKITQKLIELEPEKSEYYQWHTEYCARSGQCEEAVRAWDKWNELTTERMFFDYTRAYKMVGRAFVETGNPSEAITFFKEAIEYCENEKEDGEIHEVYRELGRIYELDGQLDKAIKSYSKSIDISPGSALAHIDLGYVYRKKGELKKAEATFVKATKLDPKDAFAQRYLGLCLLDKGQLDKAIGALKKTVKIDPQFADAHAELGKAQLDKGNSDAAIASLKKAVELDKGFANAHYYLGLAFEKIGQKDEAEAAFEKERKLKNG